MNQAEQQRLIDILDYWHKIEFFIPFDLNQVIETPDKWKLRWLEAAELAQLPPALLPEWSESLRADYQVNGFSLYLGIFGKAEIAPACRLPPPPEGDLEEEERGALDGQSCFARIRLNALGEPNFDPVSVSTVPWAVGRSVQAGLSSLGLDSFDADRARLGKLLQNFEAARQAAALPADGGAVPLGGADMAALLALFTDWAGFTPAAGQPALLLEVHASKREAPKAALPADAASVAPAPQEELEFEETVEPAIDILNSFYIEDLERAIRSLRRGTPPAALAAYLTPLAREQRVDLYTPAGRQALLAMLHPAHGNRGHWLEDTDRRMSLMQQFAINAGMRQLAGGGLFSVNGPPGTGKTTLLREIFAENIVRRAAVLAQLNTAADAFDGKVRVGFAGESTAPWMVRLKPELTGFEMVVASSNNAAVENISADLPKRKQLGKAWQGASYLQALAYRLAAEDGAGKVRALAPDDRPWGLISCALGKSANRRHFVSKFYHDAKDAAAQRDPARQNIRQWLAAYRGVGFAQAAAEYRAAADSVETALQVLAQYADLWLALEGRSQEDYCGAEQQALDGAQREEAGAGRALELAGRALGQLLNQREDLQEEERLLDRDAPGWWARLLRTAASRAHRAQVAANTSAQRGVLARIATAKKHIAGEAEPLCQRTAAALAEAQRALHVKRHAWDDAQHRLAAHRQHFALLDLPASPEQLEQERFQIGGLWHDEALAALRATLFSKALALHEAWLAEAARKGGAGFGGNLLAVTMLLENKRPEDPAHAQLIWQSLFMVVPVVSTTFASFARQFRDLGSESLGWVFIDEAGQAVPQAAAGAMWRAKRAVVVGDPLQIEPVFTVPARLVRALSALSPATAGEGYAPDKVSVQRLADDANRYGTLAPSAGADPLWIGSPLRVHRRCADPMFGLSNAIAYGGKMVFGLKQRAPASAGAGLGDSAWVEVAGTATFRQVVPAQVDFIVDVLVRLYRRDGALPQAYVISPFKAVKNAVKKQLLELDWRRAAPGREAPKKGALDLWCRQMVGTVHTFQGKEQSVVFMVLGADAATAGAAQWAASKPNLLNVALTRAQHYFYIIGEAALWRELPYFSKVAASLPAVAAGEFSARIGRPAA